MVIAKLKHLLEKDIPVLLIGAFGIGKSATVYELAEKMARERGRKLLVWHEIDEELKRELLKNPEARKQYFILVDLKGSYLSPENLIVLVPKKEDGQYLASYIIPLWARILSFPESSGLVFIDEINMTPAKLQAVLFELVLQKKIGETKLNKDVKVIAAGNPTEYNESADIIPKPLINRFALINFDEVVNLDAIAKVLAKKDIDKRVIYYLYFAGAKKLFNPSSVPFAQSTTPRTLEMLGKAIKGVTNIKEIEFYAKSLLREDDAYEFVGFVEYYEKIGNLEKYIENPDLIKELNRPDLQIVVLIKIAERLDGKSLEKFTLKLIHSNLPKELVALFFRVLKNVEEKKLAHLLRNDVVLQFIKMILSE